VKKNLLRYRLQPLLEIKTRAKKRAEIRLAQAIIRLEEEKKRLKKLEEEKEEIIKRRKECRRELHQKVSTGQAHVKDGSVRVNFLRKLEEDEKKKEEEIKAQKQVIENCELQVKRARRDYIDAAKDLRVMEKHKELWKKKLQVEMTRQEEREMDELGNVIHQMRKVA
jgi:flagellar export protein FliJ